jgi:hypothetical protein
MKKWLLPKIVALLALLWILIWIVWTALLYILSPKQEISNTSEMKLTPEQMKQLQDLTWSWSEKK